MKELPIRTGKTGRSLLLRSAVVALALGNGGALSSCDRQGLVGGINTKGGGGGAHGPGDGGPGPAANGGNGGQGAGSVPGIGGANAGGAAGAALADLQCAQPLFPALANPGVALASYPNGAIAGDWNGDGRLDFATIVYDARTISVALGKGDGTFGARRDIALDGVPQHLETVDLDRDGRPDLVVLIGDPDSTVSVFLGRGDGSFAPSNSYHVDGFPGALLVQDFTGDGLVDVLAADDVLPGRGDGTFGVARPWGGGASTVVAGDLDHDGRPDLVAHAFSGSGGRVLRNLGDGFFSPTESLALAESQTVMTMADVNADGVADLIVAFNGNPGSTDQVEVWLGNGNGGFGAVTAYDSTAFGTGLFVDVDRDGKLDVVEASAVRRGIGDGSFAVPAVSAATGGDFLLAVGDFNRDGKADLLLSDADNVVKTVLGNGDGTFGTFRLAPAAFALADLDADGKLDAAAWTDGKLRVRLGDGTGSFGAPIDSAAPYAPDSFVFADVDGDGHLDFAFAAWQGNDVSVLFGDGHGRFDALQSLRTGTFSRVLGVHDLDGDGRSDVYFQEVGDGTGAGPGPRPGQIVVGVSFGTKARAFEPPATFDVTPSAYGWEVAMTDVNDDGRLDVVVAHESPSGLTAYLGATGRTFGSAIESALDFRQGNLRLADLDRDGKVDAVVAYDLGIQPTIRILRGAGDGTFSLGAAYPRNGYLEDLSIVDLNGDHVNDLMIVQDRVTTLLGRGDGTFDCPSSYAIDLRPADVLLGDIDSDGRPDLLVPGNSYASDGASVNVVLPGLSR